MSAVAWTLILLLAIEIAAIMVSPLLEAEFGATWWFQTITVAWIPLVAVLLGRWVFRSPRKLISDDGLFQTPPPDLLREYLVAALVVFGMGAAGFVVILVVAVGPTSLPWILGIAIVIVLTVIWVGLVTDRTIRKHR